MVYVGLYAQVIDGNDKHSGTTTTGAVEEGVNMRRSREAITEAENVKPAPDDVVEVEPGLVRLGGTEFLRNGDDLVPVNASAQVNFTFTALEKHRLKRFAEEHRMSMVEVIREALKAYMK